LRSCVGSENFGRRFFLRISTGSIWSERKEDPWPVDGRDGFGPPCASVRATGVVLVTTLFVVHSTLAMSYATAPSFRVIITG